jgi:hypothetical protein
MSPAWLCALAVLALEQYSYAGERISEATVEGVANLIRGQDEFARVAATVDGTTYDLILSSYSLRSLTFKVAVFAGGTSYQVAPPIPMTFRGFVSGLPGSSVTAGVVDSRFYASVELDRDHLLTIEPFGTAGHLQGPTYRATVGSFESTVSSSRSGSLSAANGNHHDGWNPIRVCQLAFDTDVQYYQLFGNVEAATAELERILNDVDIRFERDVGVRFQLEYVVIRTSGPDGYDACVGTCDPPTLQCCTGNLLNQLSSRWENDPDLKSIPRDVVCMIFGTWPLDLGGLSGSLFCLDPVEQTGYSASHYEGTCWTVQAHEWGHLFGGQHHNNPPDNLMNSGGSCNARFFYEPDISVMRGRAGWFCLDDGSPSAVPTILTQTPPPNVPVVSVSPRTIGGSHFDRVPQLVIDDGASQHFVLDQYWDFSVLSSSIIQFQVPLAEALGPVTLVALSPSGTSNSTTFNYVVANPPALRGPSTVAVTPAGGRASVDFAGQLGYNWDLLMSTSPNMVGAVIIASGTLDSVVGRGHHDIPFAYGDVTDGEIFYFRVRTTHPGSLPANSNVLAITIHKV